jgi:hypothetical protein
VDFLFGLARNTRLVEAIKAELAEAAERSRETGKPTHRFNSPEASRACQSGTAVLAP